MLSKEERIKINTTPIKCKRCTQLEAELIEVCSGNTGMLDVIAQLEAELTDKNKQLSDAAFEIHCAGTIAHRIRILKKEHAEEHIRNLLEIKIMDQHIKIALDLEKQGASRRLIGNELRMAIKSIKEKKSE